MAVITRRHNTIATLKRSVQYSTLSTVQYSASAVQYDFGVILVSFDFSCSFFRFLVHFFQTSVLFCCLTSSFAPVSLSKPTCSFTELTCLPCLCTLLCIVSTLLEMLRAESLEQKDKTETFLPKLFIGLKLGIRRRQNKIKIRLVPPAASRGCETQKKR